jgi:hypothetical protein
VLFAFALLGCAHPRALPEEPMKIDSGLLTLEAEEPADRAQLPELARDVSTVLPGLEPWGGLRKPTRIIVLPSHQALEARTHRKGYDWLRAWARYDVVFLQSPRTFATSLGRRSELEELLLHELSHCVMYQAAAEPSDWSEREIPLWFREGFASWTARQTAQRWTLDALRAFLRSDAGSDPLGQADKLYRDQEGLVYAAAHWGFTYLVERWGQEKVRVLLATMKEGRTFPVAFEMTFGVGEPEFEQELEASWRGGAERRNTSSWTPHPTLPLASRWGGEPTATPNATATSTTNPTPRVIPNPTPTSSSALARKSLW